YGVNYVEREGISISHPSRFILVGIMNPAEGELRPQLADRIGLHINVETIQDIKERVKIMARRERFEEDPETFRREFQKEQEKLLKRILNARKLLPKVKIDDKLLELIARICVNVGVDGHRADIAILKTSKTIAAYNGRTRVLPEDLEEAVELVLGERIPERSYARQDVKRQIQRAKSEMGQEELGESEGETVGGENPPLDEQYGGESRQPSLGSADLKMTPNPSERTIQEEEVDIDFKKILKFKGKKKRRLYGSRVESKTEKGKYVKSKMLKGKSKDIAIDATLRAAALKSEDHIRVEPEDLREKIRKHGARASIALVVDISGSMFTDQKAAKIKNILNKIIKDAQRHKDKLSVIGFKGRKAEVIIPTTKRAQSFQQKVDNIRVGGTTPMAHGIKKGLEILKEEKKREEYVPVMLILSDGMPNVGMGGRPIQDVMELGKELNKNEIHTVVINFERKFQQGRNINMELAMLSGGRYYDLDQLEDPSLAIPKIMDYEREQF
ncbi:MAG: VWA domain-containing protein, partial [Methanobacteriales archaeon]|nr:VWA domain-containing protein [Methanobacteriales archaeon]